METQLRNTSAHDVDYASSPRLAFWLRSLALAKVAA